MTHSLLFELEKTLVDAQGKVFAHVLDALKTMKSFQTGTGEVERDSIHHSACCRRCSTGNWDLVKPALGTDTCSLNVFTQSQARYPLGRTQAERNRSTVPFSAGDVNPKAAVRRRSWIPFVELMSLVHVALLSRCV
jgi:hypothetical protein